jgi:hypothetical protein
MCALCLIVVLSGCDDEPTKPGAVYDRVEPCGTPTDLVDGHYDPALSHQGDLLVFWLARGWDDHGEGRGIYVHSLRDSTTEMVKEFPVVEGEFPYSVYSPRFGPEGGRIVYEYFRNLHILDIETGHVEQLTFHGDAHHPDWSRDGRWIVYHHNIVGDGERRGLHVIDMHQDPPQDEMLRYRDKAVIGWYARFSPDGTRLAYATGSAIHMVSRDGSTLVNLTPGPPEGSGIQLPGWLDDRTVVFTYSRTSPWWKYDHTFQVDTESGEINPFFVNLRDARAFSPDGTKAIVAWDDSLAFEQGQGYKVYGSVLWEHGLSCCDCRRQLTSYLDRPEGSGKGDDCHGD